MSHHPVSRVRTALIQQPWIALTFALAVVAVILLPTPAAAQCVTVNQLLQPPQPGEALNFRPTALVVYDDGGGPQVYAFPYQGSSMARTRDYVAWEPLPSPSAVSATIYNGELVVSGSALMAWNGSTWRELSAANGFARKLVTYQGSLFAIGGADYEFASWNGSQWNPVPYTAMFVGISDMCVFDSKLAVVGGFDSINGVPATGAAIFDGLAWSALPPGGPPAEPFNGGHYCAAVGNYLYVSDELLPVPTVTRWNGSVWQTLASPPMLANDMVYSVAAAYNGALVLSGAGMIDGAGVPVFAVAFDGTNWSTLAEFRGASNRAVICTTQLAGELLFGGIFDTANSVDSPFVVRWNGTEMLRATGGLAAPDAVINVLCASNDDLIIGGNFVQLNGTPLTNIAAYDGATFKPLGTGANGSVLALRAASDVTYVGGAFTQVNGAAAHGIAAWDGANWTLLGSGADEGIGGGASPRVNAIETLGNDVFVAGLFMNAGTLEGVGNIARWDGDAWHALGTGTNGEITGLAVFDGDLIALGYFTNAGGVAATNVARWNGTSWTALGFGQLFRTATTLGTELFAGARDGVYGVHRWDGTAWQPDTVAFQPKLVRELFSDGERLFAIGATSTGAIHLWQRIGAGNWLDVADALHASADDFVSYRGGLTQWNGSLFSGSPLPAIDSALTRYNFSGDPPLITTQPQGAAVYEAQPITLSVNVSGASEPVAYQWFKDGGLLAGQTSRILSIPSAVASDQGHYYVVITSPCGVTTSNTVLVTVGALCAEDINQNRRVDLSDLAMLLASFGLCSGEPSFEPLADFDTSGCVDLGDLGRLLSVYGSICQ